MMERVRILLVAAPTAPVRGLTVRLRDPDLDVLVAASAREALDKIGTATPDVIIVDGSLPGREVFRLYGRVRATAAGAAVPIIFTSHDRSDADAAPTTAPDFYLGPEASLDHIEQLLFSFLPASLVEEEADDEYDDEPLPDTLPPEEEFGPPPAAQVARPPRAQTAPSQPAVLTELLAQARTSAAAIGLAYLAIYLAAEVLAAGIDARLGLVVHAGLLLALLFHGANVPPGPERSFFWTLWLAPLARIYGLAQPYAGAAPLTLWWVLTGVSMIVAGIVAMRVGGQNAQESGLIPNPRQIPVAIFMVPVGLALGVLMSMLLEPRALNRELASGSIALIALIVIINPGIVDEIVFRGVLQKAVSSVLGTTFGVLYMALLYAPVLPAGLVSGGNLLGTVITFALGLLLSIVTLKTGSILSAAVGHASLALGLFVIGPYLVPGIAGPVAGTPIVPATLEVRPPTQKPAIVISPTPIPPQVQPGQTTQPGQPGQTTQPGQAPKPTTPSAASKPSSPPAQTPPSATGQPPTPDGQQSGPPPTPFTLAPPLPTPTSPAPTSAPAPPPASGTALIPGQIVVVRGTGGSGARLRAQPGSSGPIITVIPEYSPLVVIGQDRIVDGIAWRNVRAPSGAEGWIAAAFVTTG
ncbi:MAG: CPBP family glutamic-type intramembrane protease [Chloroflexota bacterium]